MEKTDNGSVTPQLTSGVRQAPPGAGSAGIVDGLYDGVEIQG